VQILIGPEDEQRVAEADLGLAPRLDYRLVAEQCNATVLQGHPAPTGFTGPKTARVLRSMAENLTWSARTVSRAPRMSTIYSTGETWGLPVALAARLLGRQDLIHIVYLHRVFSPSWLQAMRMLQSVLHVDGWVCVTRHQADLIRGALRSGAAPVVSISQGVDTRFYAPHKANRAESPGYILSVGAEMRDYRLLLQAVRDLSTQMIIKIGSNWMQEARHRLPEVPANTRLISERLSYSRMRDLYEGAALIAVPLFDTPQAAGITNILEAMAMRKCVVATRSRGLPDCLISGATGLVSEPSAEALADAICGLLRSPERLEALADNANCHVRDRLSLESHAKAVDDFVERVGTGP
jgi:glycosyltransferase involved in cell wall biosynthesis